MKRKSLIFLMCLILTVFTMAPAMADDMETVTTITVQPGPLLGADEMLQQIFDIAAISFHSMPDNYGGLVLSLNGNDVLSIALKLVEDGIFAQTEITGQTPLYFCSEDVSAYMMQQMGVTADMQAMNDASNTVDVEMWMALMNGSLSQEEAMTLLGIDDDLLTLMNDVESMAIVETGSFAINGSDLADTKTSITMEKEDIVSLLDNPYFRNMILDQMAPMGPMDITMTEEEMNQELDAALVDAKQEILDGNMRATFAVLTAGDEFVALEIDLSGASDMYDTDINITVTRTTVESAQYYKMSVVISEDDTSFAPVNGTLFMSDDFITGQLTFNNDDSMPMLAMSLNCDTSQPDYTMGELAFEVNDYGTSNALLIVFDQKRDGDTKDTEINLYVGERKDEIKASLDSTDLITLNFHTETLPESGMFTALKEATPEASVQLLQMSEDELNAYIQGLEQGFMITLMNALDNLPPELSNQLMQGMSGF